MPQPPPEETKSPPDPCPGIPIPEAVRAFLEAPATSRKPHGVVQSRLNRKGETRYRLRFRAKDPMTGRTRHRSIELANEAVANVVGRHLALLHQQHINVAFDKERARMAQRAEKQRRSDNRDYCRSIGTSRRDRCRIGKQFDQVADDPREVMTLIYELKGRSDRRGPGRPVKKRLW